MQSRSTGASLRTLHTNLCTFLLLKYIVHKNFEKMANFVLKKVSRIVFESDCRKLGEDVKWTVFCEMGLNTKLFTAKSCTRKTRSHTHHGSTNQGPVPLCHVSLTNHVARNSSRQLVTSKRYFLPNVYFRVTNFEENFLPKICVYKKVCDRLKC